MARKRIGPEQTIAHLRESETRLAKGETGGQVFRMLGITSNTYYQWHREYGGLEVDQAKRPKDLKLENARLKKVVVDQALDIAILKEASRGNF
jgi:putative transposase